jgi:hypothetical protein
MWVIALTGGSCRNLNLGRKHPGFEGQAFVTKIPLFLKSGVPETRKRRSKLADLSNQNFVRSQSVVARVIAGETLIVPVRAKVGDLASIYSFNGTGSLIWKLLESPKTVTELASAVAQEYEVGSAQAEKDVTEFVGEMKTVGLVEVAAAMAMAGD